MILEYYLNENIYNTDTLIKPIRLIKPNNNKYVYVILTNTKSFVCKAITKVTSSDYNHACIALDDTMRHVYGIGRRLLNPETNKKEIFLGKEELDKGVYAMNDATFIELRFPVTDEQYSNLKKVLNQTLKEHNKYKFDMFGLVRSGILNIKSENGYKVFCSGLVSEIMNKAGIYLFDKHFSLVRPNDFLMHPDAEVVAKGNLNDLFRKRHK